MLQRDPTVHLAVAPASQVCLNAASSEKTTWIPSSQVALLPRFHGHNAHRFLLCPCPQAGTPQTHTTPSYFAVTSPAPGTAPDTRQSVSKDFTDGHTGGEEVMARGHQRHTPPWKRRPTPALACWAGCRELAGTSAGHTGQGPREAAPVMAESTGSTGEVQQCHVRPRTGTMTGDQNVRPR